MRSNNLSGVGVVYILSSCPRYQPFSHLSPAVKHVHTDPVPQPNLPLPSFHTRGIWSKHSSSSMENQLSYILAVSCSHFHLHPRASGTPHWIKLMVSQFHYSQHAEVFTLPSLSLLSLSPLLSSLLPSHFITPATLLSNCAVPAFCQNLSSGRMSWPLSL